MLGISVAAGLAALCFWGTSDVFASIALKKEEVVTVLIVGSVASVVVLAPVGYFVVPRYHMSVHDLAVALLAGAIGAAAILGFFKGIKADRVSFVTPVSSAWPVITVPLAIAFLGDSFTPPEALGALLVVAGVVAIGFKAGGFRAAGSGAARQGLTYGFLAMGLWGILYLLIGSISASTGWFDAPATVVAVNLPIFYMYARKTSKPSWVSSKALGVAVAAGLLNTLGLLTFGIGSAYGDVAVLSPIAAGSPLLAIVLAHLFLGEKLTPNEKAGVVLLVAGTIILSV